MKNFKLLQFLNRTNSSSTFDRNSDSTKSPSAPFILPPVHSTNNIRPFSMRYRTTGSRKKSDIPKWITRVEIVQKPSLVSKMSIFRPKWVVLSYQFVSTSWKSTFETKIKEPRDLRHFLQQTTRVKMNKLSWKCHNKHMKLYKSYFFKIATQSLHMSNVIKIHRNILLLALMFFIWFIKW